jgi:hypothetical protein
MSNGPQKRLYASCDARSDKHSNKEWPSSARPGFWIRFLIVRSHQTSLFNPAAKVPKDEIAGNWKRINL